MVVVDVGALPAVPLDALRELARLETELGNVRRVKIEAARQAGATWEQVGTALGMSRQGAWEYYTRTARAALEHATADSELNDDEATQLVVEELNTVRRQRRR